MFKCFLFVKFVSCLKNEKKNYFFFFNICNASVILISCYIIEKMCKSITK